MREVQIKENKVTKLETIPDGDLWEHIEKFLDDNECHILPGTVAIVNKRELVARRTYEKKDGTIVLFDEGRPSLEIGTEVEIHNKISKTPKPRIEVRW